MEDDLGNIVSRFVEEWVDEPNPNEVDLWCEAVYAALFSVAFEIVTRLSSARESANNFESETNEIIDETCHSAARCVEAWLLQVGRKLTGCEIRFDLKPVMRSRMVLYFDTAYKAMADRGYQRETARSHACFAILSECVTQLVESGQAIRPLEARAFVQNAFEACESMSRETAKLIGKQASQRN